MTGHTEKRHVHCREDRHNWTRDNEGWDAYVEIVNEPSATCLLPHGHDGPHEWTPDDRITIRFVESGR